MHVSGTLLPDAFVVTPPLHIQINILSIGTYHIKHALCLSYLMKISNESTIKMNDEDLIEIWNRKLEGLLCN